jgi:hypothetical protein
MSQRATSSQGLPTAGSLGDAPPQASPVTLTEDQLRAIIAGASSSASANQQPAPAAPDIGAIVAAVIAAQSSQSRNNDTSGVTPLKRFSIALKECKEVPQLTGKENYLLWQQRIDRVLGLWAFRDCVVNPYPSDPDVDRDIDFMEIARSHSNDTPYQRQERMYAFGLIEKTLSSEVHNLADSCKVVVPGAYQEYLPRVLWLILHEAFVPTNRMDQINAWQALSNIRHTRDISVQAFTQAHMDGWKRLQESMTRYPDIADWRVFNYLLNLDSKFDHYINFLVNSLKPGEQLTIPRISLFLQDKAPEYLLRAENDNSKTPKAFKAAQKSHFNT